jgi:hypothetical protein
VDIAALALSCTALAASCWSVWLARRSALRTAAQPPAAPPPYPEAAGDRPVCYRTPGGIRVHGPSCQCPP